MPWTDPKINWNENYEPSPEDMNRIERNTLAIKDEELEIDGEKTFADDTTFEQDVTVNGDATFSGNAEVEGTLTSENVQVNGSAILDGGATISGNASVSGTLFAATVSTGHGSNELYPMNQGVRTTDNVTFASVNTGQGANELYAMNQNVRTTDNVSFNSISLSGGKASAHYTGSTTEETNLPIGSIVLVISSATAASNALVPIRVAYGQYFVSELAPQLAGTWRSRGWMNVDTRSGADILVLCQRVS